MVHPSVVSWNELLHTISERGVRLLGIGLVSVDTYYRGFKALRLRMISVVDSSGTLLSSLELLRTPHRRLGGPDRASKGF